MITQEIRNSYKLVIYAWVFVKSCDEFVINSEHKIIYSRLKFSYSDCGFLGRVKEELWIKWKFMQIEQPTATKKRRDFQCRILNTFDYFCGAVWDST